MKAGTLRVTTRAGGDFTNFEYTNAAHRVEAGFLLITHEGSDGMKLLSRVPLCNVVQMLETMPEKPS